MANKTFALDVQKFAEQFNDGADYTGAGTIICYKMQVRK